VTGAGVRVGVRVETALGGTGSQGNRQIELMDVAGIS